MKNIIILIVLLSISISALANESTANSSTDEVIQNNILMYVNKYRREQGLNALKPNTSISLEARRHSQDMATHKIPFGHQYFPDRIKRLYSQIKFCRSGAENVAFNYKDTKDLVRRWIASPGHRKNIVGHYNLTGIGIARDKNGKIYYTQIFLLNDNPAPQKAHQ